MAPGEGRKTFPGWPGPSSGRTRGRRSSRERALLGSPMPYRSVFRGLVEPSPPGREPPPCPPRAQGPAERPLCCWEVLWVSIRGSR